MQPHHCEQRLASVLHNLPDFTHQHINFDALQEEMDATVDTIQVRDRPRLYQLETTSRCNLACTFCPRTIDLAQNNQRSLDEVMPLDKFQHVLDQFPDLQSIELFHFGEPFMHRDLHLYIAECKRRGIYVVIASNLLPAVEWKVNYAFAEGLDFLVMDVDSLDPDRYASMRVNGHLGLLQRRCRHILNHPKRPYCVVQTIQVDGVPEYSHEQLAEWLGADCKMPDEVRYKFLDSFRGTVVEKQGLQPDEVCREAFYGCTIHVNGNVVPCDRDWAGDNVMGNIFEQSMQDIWHGERFSEFRARMRSASKPDMCTRCAEGRLFNARSQPHIQVNMFKGGEVEA